MVGGRGRRGRYHGDDRTGGRHTTGGRGCVHDPAARVPGRGLLRARPAARCADRLVDAGHGGWGRDPRALQCVRHVRDRARLGARSRGPRDRSTGLGAVHRDLRIRPPPLPRWPPPFATLALVRVGVRDRPRPRHRRHLAGAGRLRGLGVPRRPEPLRCGGARSALRHLGVPVARGAPPRGGRLRRTRRPTPADDRRRGSPSDPLAHVRGRPHRRALRHLVHPRRGQRDVGLRDPEPGDDPVHPDPGHRGDRRSSSTACTTSTS